METSSNHSPAAAFHFHPFTIDSYLPDTKRKQVYKFTFPRFRDQQDLTLYRRVVQERIDQTRKKIHPYDKAILEVLTLLEDYLYGELP